MFTEIPLIRTLSGFICLPKGKKKILKGGLEHGELPSVQCLMKDL